MSKNKPKVLFVGAFKAAGVDGTVGGITFACRTLLESDQSQDFHWLLVDSTASTNKRRSLLTRTVPAIVRLLIFVWYLLTNRCHKVVLFAAHGLSFYEKGLMALLAKRFKVPVVFAPTSGFLVEELSTGTFKSKYAKKIFTASESIVCQSDYWKTFYSEYCDDNRKLKVVQNWIDTDQYPQSNKTDKFSDTTILYMSWVVREKGIFEFLQAIDHLQNELNKHFTVLVCGDGDDLFQAQEYAEVHSLKNVEFKGWTVGRDKAKYLLSSHIYVLPSYAEGLSNSLLEAMVSGLAVVSTDVGGAVDVVEDGINGFLVEAGSTEQLMEKLLLLLESEELRYQFGDAARESILRENSIEVGVSRFMALLK